MKGGLNKYTVHKRQGKGRQTTIIENTKKKERIEKEECGVSE